jgi:hypothetical protein
MSLKLTLLLPTAKRLKWVVSKVTGYFRLSYVRTLIRTAASRVAVP